MKFRYLAQYQRFLFEEFKFRADGSPEVMDRSFFSISDYLALMQHYQVKTSLMDWSEDAFTSLYFAEEELVNNPDAKAGRNAAVFVFSPHLYNEARREMMREAGTKVATRDRAFVESMKTAERSDGLIPNVAAVYNEKAYDMFLMGNTEYESKNQLGYSESLTLNGGQEMAFLPAAVYTSRLNPRIRSQSGIFLAFNLYAEPSKYPNPYEYLELGKIQEYYFNSCQAKNKKQFLYKIVIEKQAAPEIANYMRRIGITKERIYPELSNIGSRIR